MGAHKPNPNGSVGCEHSNESFLEYFYGSMEVKQQKLFENHVAGCDSCRDLAEAEQAFIGFMNKNLSNAIRMDDDTRRRLTEVVMTTPFFIEGEKEVVIGVGESKFTGETRSADGQLLKARPISSMQTTASEETSEGETEGESSMQAEEEGEEDEDSNTSAPDEGAQDGNNSIRRNDTDTHAAGIDDKFDGNGLDISNDPGSQPTGDDQRRKQDSQGRRLASIVSLKMRYILPAIFSITLLLVYFAHFFEASPLLVQLGSSCDLKPARYVGHIPGASAEGLLADAGLVVELPILEGYKPIGISNHLRVEGCATPVFSVFYVADDDAGQGFVLNFLPDVKLVTDLADVEFARAKDISHISVNSVSLVRFRLDGHQVVLALSPADRSKSLALAKACIDAVGLVR